MAGVPGSPWPGGAGRDISASRYAARRDGRRQEFAPSTDAGLAQLAEHLICNQGVAGSNPAAGTNDINMLCHCQRLGHLR